MLTEAGTTFELVFRGNRTTGFEWKLLQPFANDSGCVNFVNQSYKSHRSEPGMTGVGGLTTMKFDMVDEAGCNQALNLGWARPWDTINWDRVDTITTVNVISSAGWKKVDLKPHAMNSISLHPGKQLSLRIKGNATTGFTWQISPFS